MKFEFRFSTEGELVSSKVIAKIAALIKYLGGMFIITMCFDLHGRNASSNFVVCEKNVPLVKIFKDIVQQDDYAFIYKRALLRYAPRVSINAHNVTLYEILKTCLPESYSFFIRDKRVYILQENDPPREIDVEFQIMQFYMKR